ncbi:hypothetical protein B0H19DRAFT_1365001 [Mycena capillaripes]|nr:hypothetical protein B0H19DRAFT_1365001 [Mycena capillaripes]
MPDAADGHESDDSAQTPQHDSEEQLGITPRISSASPASGREDGEGAQSTRAAESAMQGIESTFANTRNPAFRRLNSLAAEDDDETASTTTDRTEFSTTAQAGSSVPSSPGSPATPTEDEIEKSAAAGGEAHDGHGGAEQSDADASPFWNQDHASAKKGEPPTLNLAPRTHPLAGEGAEHGGVPLCEDAQAEMDDERADGTRGPAYGGAVDEEDSYSSDEAMEDGKVKRLVKRVKGGAKVIGGRMRGDKEKVKEGQDMIAAT